MLPKQIHVLMPWWGSLVLKSVRPGLPQSLPGMQKIWICALSEGMAREHLCPLLNPLSAPKYTSLLLISPLCFAVFSMCLLSAWSLSLCCYNHLSRSRGSKAAKNITGMLVALWESATTAESCTKQGSSSWSVYSPSSAHTFGKWRDAGTAPVLSREKMLQTNKN